MAFAWGHRPEDDEETRFAKRLVNVYCFVGPVFAGAFAISLDMGELHLAARMQDVIAALFLANLFVFWIDGDLRWVLRRVIALNFLGSALGHYLAGGTSNSGGSIVWGLAGVSIAAVMFSRREAAGWLLAYAATIVAVGVLSAAVPLHIPPVEIGLGSRFNFLMNLVLLALATNVPVFDLANRRAALQRELTSEHDRSERLLLNVLPPSIAARLKRGDAVIADRLDEVTVLFGDLVGFTELASSKSPEELVKLLDGVFTTFDALAVRHRLEKIKTIGDAYMVAAGVPTPRPDHARAAAEMALDMMAAIRAHPEWGALDMRIGLNSGPVVAGVIGRSKFTYDLWGDTVNVASRMESHGQAGAIHVSATTEALLREGYVLEPRGEVTVKGKGTLRTHFLTGRRPEA